MEQEIKKIRKDIKGLYSLPTKRLLYLSVFLFIITIAIFAVIVAITGGGHEFREVRNVPVLGILAAVMQTFGRIIIAYIFAVIFSVLLAIFTVRSKRVERILLPTIEILQSVPALAFFPILVFLFVQFGFSNLAAIVIFFFTMLWTMTFTLVVGLKIIPKDIFAMAKVFHISKYRYVWNILIPAIMPQLIASSIIAWSQSWNIAIVAEVFHTYLPASMVVRNLPGIGSELVKAISSGNVFLFLSTITILLIFIVFINIFVWQNLFSYVQRFKFE